MKIKHLLFCAAVAAISASCEQPQTDLGLPSIEVSVEELEFDKDGGDQMFTLTATRDWIVDNLKADWIVVSPSSGKASAEAQTIMVSVLENTKMDRSEDIIFTIGMSSRAVTVKQAGPGGSAEQLILYSNDFDKEVATQTYGSGTSWPYLDQFEGWKNQTGSGAANVSYDFNGMSARANSKSDSNYSDYEGSGSNNLFFGSKAYFSVNNISLNGAADLGITFGTEKYSQTLGSVFTNSEFHIWLSQDGSKWVEFKDYTFAGGTTEGRWNLASADFSVPSGTENLSICFEADAASAYRIDDLKLVIAETSGTAVDFSGAVEKEFGTGSSGGGITTPEKITDVTIAEFNEKPVSTSEWYRIKGTVGTGSINTTYGNFDIVDETGTVYVYGTSNWDSYKSSFAAGGKIVFVGQRGDYNGKVEVLNGYIESYEPGENQGGGDEPGGESGQYDPQGITWTLGTNAYDNTSSGTSQQSAVVNGVQVNNLLKLGKSSAAGDATIHIPAGTAKVGFYAMSWKGTPAEVKITMGDNSMTINPPANAGASGNPPYTITLAEDGSDYFEIPVPVSDAVDVKVETTNASAGRVIFVGLKAIAE